MNRKQTIKMSLVLVFALSTVMNSAAFGMPNNTQLKADFCQKITGKFKTLGWKRIICNPNTWEVDPNYQTPDGSPLLYQVFNSHIKDSTTLVMCGVHGDEISSIYQCFFLTREILFDNPEAFKNSRIVVAPIVNPDGFLKSPSTRTNKNGIDLNRNFPTTDFAKTAIAEWQNKEKGLKQKYPGTIGGSEVETRFQMMLLDKYSPHKIISIHSPYGWLDVNTPPADKKNLDSPDGFSLDEVVRQANDIAKVMSRMSNNFKVTNFRVYPGSLGNYAAHEKGIPTFTLELESSDAPKGPAYWQKMKRAIVAAIQYEIKSGPDDGKTAKIDEKEDHEQQTKR